MTPQACLSASLRCCAPSIISHWAGALVAVSTLFNGSLKSLPYLPAAGQWAAALGVVERMEARGCRRDAATYSLLLTALDKGHQWRRALQVSRYWLRPW